MPRPDPLDLWDAFEGLDEPERLVELLLILDE